MKLNPSPLVYAIVLTWNSGDAALDCLASLMNQEYPNLRILVVDNASEDRTRQSVAEQFPTIPMICLDQNQGFAGGNNVGIRHALDAGADYVLLLNDDTTMTPDALALMVAADQADPTIGLIGPALVSCRDMTQIYVGAHIHWDSGSATEILATPEMLSTPLIRTDYVPGCALLVNRAVIDRIGLLDERYFAYYEDVDWCLRAAEAGYRCTVTPAARVSHVNTADVRATGGDGSLYYPRRNQFLFLRRYQHRAVPQGMRKALTLCLREYNHLILHGESARAHTLVAGVWDGLRGVSGRGTHTAPRSVFILWRILAWIYTTIHQNGQTRRLFQNGSRSRLKLMLKRIIQPVAYRLAQPLPSQLPPAPPVAVVGYISASSGMGEVARGTIVALQRIGQQVEYIDIDPAPTLAAQDLPPQRSPRDVPVVNLVHVNAVNVRQTYKQMGTRFFTNRLNIGIWYWEMPTFPRAWYGAFSLFDEIWVASRYTQASLASIAPIPVVYMRPVVQPAPPNAHRRGDFGIPVDRFVFFFSFDALSILPRKNPVAVIQAFQLAFGAPKAGPLLVIKVNNSDKVVGRDAQLGLHDGYMAELSSAVAQVNGILLDRRYDRPTTSALMSLCDCYVSLHRCEGLGLTMAEAMYFGKPCIATGYSGNLDFMTPSNSYLVGYRLVELDRDWGPYQAGDYWAEPEVEQAAALMQEVFAQPSDAFRRGERAAAEIRQNYGAEAVGQKMQQRLQLLAWRTNQGRKARFWLKGSRR